MMLFYKERFAMRKYFRNFAMSKDIKSMFQDN